MVVAMNLLHDDYAAALIVLVNPVFVILDSQEVGTP